MSRIKPLSEQTLMNNYVFASIMRDSKKIKPLLEYILGKKIRKINLVEPEKTFKETFASKGIRLDLYVEDEDGIVYDVEVQTTNRSALPRRMRYYQGMLDITFFKAGSDYNKMRKSYVIFICNFDKYGRSRYIYTFQNRCDQDPELLFGDDAVKVVVNTKGTVGDISPELKEALIYLDHEEVTGPYSRELDEAVKKLKSDEEKGEEYMMLMTYGAEQRAAGEYTKLVHQIRKWTKKKKPSSVEDAADVIDVSVPVFNEVVKVISENPDWDDEDVASEVDWML